MLVVGVGERVSVVVGLATLAATAMAVVAVVIVVVVVVVVAVVVRTVINSSEPLRVKASWNKVDGANTSSNAQDGAEPYRNHGWRGGLVRHELT